MGLRGTQGFTLLELILVVVLFALITALAVTRIDSILVWKVEGDIRKFAGVWEFLFNEAYGRGEQYRLVINLDQNSYYVRREVPLTSDTVVEVDYLENLRTKSEKERRARKAEEKLLSLEEEFTEEDQRQGGPIDELYYQTLFSDPESPKRLARPLEFPSLAKEEVLTDGLTFRDVAVRGEKTESGRIFLRVSPWGSAEHAVVHFEVNEQIFSVTIHPATGSVSIINADVEIETPIRKVDEQKN